MTVDGDLELASPTAGDQPIEISVRRNVARGSHRGRTLVITIALLAMVILAGWVVWFSPFLSVSQVTVKGDSTLPAGEITAAANVALGTPLARVNDDEVAQRIQALPRVGSVEVRRGFPHELVLVVNERIPVAVVSSPGSTLHTVDSTGAIIGRVTTAGSLPIITSTSPEGRSAALAAIAAMPASVLGQVASLSAQTNDSVTLTLKQGASVEWGDASRAERKARVLSALMHRKARVYDVSAPDFPTTRG